MEGQDDEASKLRKSLHRRFSIGQSDFIDSDDVDAIIEQRLANGLASRGSNPSQSSSGSKSKLRHSAGVVLDSKIQDILSVDMSRLSVEDLLNKPSPLSVSGSSYSQLGLKRQKVSDRTNGTVEQRSKILPQTGVYRAIKDFRPEQLLSQHVDHTTHLPLSEGDTVRVLGE